MKKILLGLLLAIIALGIAWYFFLSASTPTQVAKTKTTSLPTSAPLPSIALSQKTLFVPYWEMQQIADSYNTYIYFGITPDDQGINTNEDGYANLSSFSTTIPSGKRTLLAVRMLDKDLIGKVLDDPHLQEQIIQDSIQTAQSYGFSGIVLDLEYSGLAFPSVTKSVTDFSVQFAKEVKQQDLAYYQMLPGDTFYLARPFNVAEVAKAADGIFVMSYDFHKANGTPGPNFPLNSLPDADYNFSNMLADFSKVVPKNKLTIVFGLFGYDWTVDGQGRPESTAESLTSQEIEKKFFPTCPYAHCSIDTNSALEKDITYIDTKNQRHIVWFEDMASVGKKEAVMQQKGFSQVGFWANGYF